MGYFWVTFLGKKAECIDLFVKVLDFSSWAFQIHTYIHEKQRGTLPLLDHWGEEEAEPEGKAFR